MHFKKSESIKYICQNQKRDPNTWPYACDSYLQHQPSFILIRTQRHMCLLYFGPPSTVQISTFTPLMNFHLNYMQLVMVILKGSVAISFNGNKEPAAYAEIVSMGGIDREVKRKLIATIGSILQARLCIRKERFFLKVYDTTAGQAKAASKLWSLEIYIYIYI